MATYTKKLKTLTITLFGGDTVTIADTASVPSGSMALAQFEAYETIVADISGTITYIPFHAILMIAVAEADSDPITKKDPYGCDETDASEGGDESEGGDTPEGDDAT